MRHVKCSDSAKVIYLDKEAVFKALKAVSEELREKLPYLKEVMLFGSLAKGEEHGLSDVDLLVIVEEARRNTSSGTKFIYPTQYFRPPELNYYSLSSRTREILGR